MNLKQTRNQIDAYLNTCLEEEYWLACVMSLKYSELFANMYYLLWMSTRSRTPEWTAGEAWKGRTVLLNCIVLMIW